MFYKDDLALRPAAAQMESPCMTTLFALQSFAKNSYRIVTVQ